MKKKWNFEKLFKVALKYKTRGEFKKKNYAAYQAAHKMGIIDQVCPHMPLTVVEAYTYDELKEEALKYKTRILFQRNSSSIYQISQRKGILDQICAHMESGRDKWTHNELTTEALKYKTRNEFKVNNRCAYNAARRNKILNQICGHMKSATRTSVAEADIFKIISERYSNVRKLIDRKITIEGKPYIHGFDIDIFVPVLNLGIEYDGIYSHSFKGLKRGRKHWPDSALRQYHEIKDAYFLSKGIKILHIKEVDWNADKQACIQRCLDFLASGVLSEVA